MTGLGARTRGCQAAVTEGSLAVLNRPPSPLRLIAGGMIAVLAACADDPIVPQTDAIPSGSVTADDEEQRDALAELTRLLALSLADEQTRQDLRQSLAASPFRESKVSVKQYLSTGEGAALADRMATNGGITRAELNDLRSRAPDLELYLPVDEHRAVWKGGSELIVASSLTDHEIPAGFRLSGEPFPFTSAETPPPTPVLALVPVETDFSRQPAASRSIRRSAGSSSPDGVYMTAAYIPDDHEGFLRGDPEFEVHLQVQQTSQDTAIDAHCAGNDAPDLPSRYNHDDPVWEGWVLIAPEQKLANLYALVPDSTIATFVVWEDDTDPCEVVDENPHWTWWIGVFVAAAQGPSLILQGGFTGVLSGTAILGAAVSVVNELLGGADDIVGALTSSGCQIPGCLHVRPDLRDLRFRRQLDRRLRCTPGSPESPATADREHHG